MATYVRHQTFGNGVVTNLSEKYIIVKFDNCVKKFQFPWSFDSYLETDDPDLLAKIANSKKGNIPPASFSPKSYTNSKQSEKDALRNAIRNTATTKTPIRTNHQVLSSLVGPRAQTITVRSEAEKFEIVGYIASPGRVSSFEAEIPCDGHERIFERMFPGQTYRPIGVSDTPSGATNKYGPQFRINFLDISNCPSVLRSNMGSGNGSCVGRINKSKFVVDLVTNYGFRFGSFQNFTEIQSIAEKYNYLKEFEKGLNR